MITVSRELYPADQDESVNAFQCANSAYPIYAEATGLAMLEVRRSAETSQMWRSPDNGETWTLADEIPIESATLEGLFTETSVGPLYRDPDNGRIVRFQQQRLYTVPASARPTYFESRDAFVPNSHTVYYQVSVEGGHTWTASRQLIEQGEGFNPNHWAQDVTFREGCAVLGEPPPFHKLADGRIVFPCQVRTAVNADTLGSIQAGRFYAEWDAEGTGLTWTSGGRVPGGGCEQTIAPLADGRLLNILRAQGQIKAYPFDAWLRPCTVSDDGGVTWSEPRPLAFDDGQGLTSPRAWSVLIRSEANGRLYWIANILPAFDTEASAAIRSRYTGRADPRYPLCVAEVDEAAVALKHDTLTVIQDREPHMPHWVRLSNYHVYNDRETGDLVVLMLVSYCEHQEDRGERPWPSYRYRITVGA